MTTMDKYDRQNRTYGSDATINMPMIAKAAFIIIIMRKLPSIRSRCQ